MEIINYCHDNGKKYNMTFEKKNGQIMVNATEMAKPFGKKVNNFTRILQTKNYLEVLEKQYADKSIGFKAYETIKGGSYTKRKPGTWMCEKLALKFAAWLSPEFELWIFDQIETLLKTGRVEIRTSRPMSLEEHLLPENQIKNSKSINHKIYEITKRKSSSQYMIMNYNKKSCKLHTGLTPSQLKEAAKKFGYKSKDRTSGKQVLRTMQPEIACQMSFTDSMICSNPQFTHEDINYVYENITKKTEAVYKAMIDAGIRPPELDQE